MHLWLCDAQFLTMMTLGWETSCFLPGPWTSELRTKPQVSCHLLVGVQASRSAPERGHGGFCCRGQVFPCRCTGEKWAQDPVHLLSLPRCKPILESIVECTQATISHTFDVTSSKLLFLKELHKFSVWIGPPIGREVMFLSSFVHTHAHTHIECWFQDELVTKNNIKKWTQI